MKIVYLSILFLTLQTVIYSQHSKDSSKVYEFLFVDKIPKFSLKDGSFQEYLQSHITSPKYFDGESKVVVSFIINENGAVSNIVVLNSTTEICSNIVTNVLKNMPKWKPGIYKGTKVKVRLYVEIDFTIK